MQDTLSASRAINAFGDGAALRTAKAIRKLLEDESAIGRTVAVYNDPDDYRTPLFQERQREIAAKVARVNEALEALREALS